VCRTCCPWLWTSPAKAGRRGNAQDAAREKELSQLKSNFVSMVSHEFRTPLGIIQSSAELLRDYYNRMQSDERDEQLDSIFRNTRRMGRDDGGNSRAQPA